MTDNPGVTHNPTEGETMPDATDGMSEEQLAARYGVTVEQWRAGLKALEENDEAARQRERYIKHGPELVECMRKARDTFADTELVCNMLHRLPMAEAMRIAKEACDAVLLKVEGKD